jgi:uracil-DNA glycosylase
VRAPVAALGRNGFFGSTPFTIINRELKRIGQEPVDWCVPNL